MSDQLTILGSKIGIDKNEYINITDIAKFRSDRPGQVIQNWLRLIYTLRFLAAWEKKNNSKNFKKLFEFCTAISPEFKLELIHEWQKLRGLDTAQKVRRELAKANHALLTSAISENVDPKLLGTSKARIYYASELDMLNVVVFGMTAKL